jgi:Hint domain
MHTIQRVLIAFSVFAVSMVIFAILLLGIRPASAFTQECGQITSASDVPSGFGAPVNVFFATQEQVLSVTRRDSGAQVNVGSGSTDQYIYNQGYEYVNNAWRRILFSGTNADGSWIVGNASTALTRTAADLAQTNYVVAYICTRVDSAWKCGCRDNTCATSYWQLQTCRRPLPVSLMPTGTSTTQNIAALKYKILGSVGEPLLCPPPASPSKQAWNQQLLAMFPSVKADMAEFNEILTHLGLSAVTNWTDDLKLRVVNEHRRLLLVSVTGISGGTYHFSVNATPIVEGSTPKPAYHRYEGTITDSGRVTVTKQILGYSSCPICLARDTRIATPNGEVAVQDITSGTKVWTLNAKGERVSAPVLKVGSTQVPIGHQVVHLALTDGTSLFVSPGHPTADGRTIGELKNGDTLNGVVVQGATLVSYTSGYTYDILPAGGTGEYFANGIPIGSTLK